MGNTHTHSRLSTSLKVEGKYNTMDSQIIVDKMLFPSITLRSPDHKIKRRFFFNGISGIVHLIPHG